MSKVVMVKAYAHKSSGYVRKEQKDKGEPVWEEAHVSRVVNHPTLGQCYVGSFIAGVGMFDVYFPIGDARLATQDEIQLLCARAYAGCGMYFKLKPEDFATASYLAELPIMEAEESKPAPQPVVMKDRNHEAKQMFLEMIDNARKKETNPVALLNWTWLRVFICEMTDEEFAKYLSMTNEICSRWSLPSEMREILVNGMRCLYTSRSTTSTKPK